MLARLSETAIHWPRSYRIVPSRFPPIDLFEGVAGEPGDLDALNELEGLTSRRLREEAGEIHLVAEEDRRYGPGCTPVMAAFTYPRESRFSDGSFGLYYCTEREGTAVAESRFHRERFLRESSQPSITAEMRVYIAELRASLIDLCAAGGAPYLNPDDWGPSQRLGLEAREAMRYGFVYPSVRDQEQGLCAGVLRPPALGAAQQGSHLGYKWDGERITDVVELGETPY